MYYRKPYDSSDAAIPNVARHYLIHCLLQCLADSSMWRFKALQDVHNCRGREKDALIHALPPIPLIASLHHFQVLGNTGLSFIRMLLSETGASSSVRLDSVTHKCPFLSSNKGIPKGVSAE